MRKLSVERCIRIMAGSFVLVSVGLGIWVSKWWFLFTVFVALNLIQWGFTDFCPSEVFLKKLGLKKEKDL